MIVSQYFVEFIFYSFLGWVWESIYCTVQEKKWADRGFLFGPVCPIYGSCVVVTSFLFSHISIFADPSFPIWGIFIICMIGSAVAEFGTSWFLEKRFHARWWDYSHLPLNIQGRICLPVSVAFGLAGLLVVKFLIPAMNHLHSVVHPIIYEILALVFAAVFGADFALTEASLSALLKSVEDMHTEFVEKAQSGYEKVTSAPKIISQKIAEEKENVEEKRERLGRLYAEKMSMNQKRILGSIRKFTPKFSLANETDITRLQLTNTLKEKVRDLKKKKEK